MTAKNTPAGQRIQRGPRITTTTTQHNGPGVILLAGHAVFTGAGAVLEAPQAGPADEILDRLHGKLGDNGLVLIGPDEPSWEYLTRQASRWKIVGGGTAWYTALRGGSALRLCLLSTADRENDPLIGDDHATTALRHQWYADLTGVPFYGDGGTTGALLMDTTINVKGSPPLRSWKEGPRVVEPSWPGPWSGEGTPGIQLDKNAYYLAAANSALLPLDALTYAEKENPRDRVGLWRIRIPANPFPRLPHPCGASAPVAAWKWVAQPTMDLLRELAMTPEIDGSWTCPRDRARRALVPWYERLRDARSLSREMGSDQDSKAVQRAVKDTYSRGIGCLDREGRRWYRPDWRAVLYAQARTCMWRAMWKAGMEEGRWPVETRTDMVVYEGDQPPARFKVGTGMGEWKVTRR